MANTEAQTTKSDPGLKSKNKGRSKRWIETFSTILLSAATVLSAWCVYEASQWSGEQYFRIEDMNSADRKRMQKEIAARQRLVGESQLFLQLVDAISNDNEEKEAFLWDRLPSHLKEAAIAWKALDPVHNKDAPISPMQMEEYEVPEEAEIDKYAKQANDFKIAANECDSRSDNYMMLSLVLSTVLFFCGLVGVTDTRSNKLILLSFASIIFLVTVYFVIKFPVIL